MPIVLAILFVGVTYYATYHVRWEVVEGRGYFPLCERSHEPNCVIDGDTIQFKGVKIRLSDIDTPEIFSPACEEERRLGNQAKWKLKDLINRGPFALVRYGFTDEDIYGRKLRVIERDGRSLCDELVATGLAHRSYLYKLPWYE